MATGTAVARPAAWQLAVLAALALAAFRHDLAHRPGALVVVAELAPLDLDALAGRGDGAGRRARHQRPGSIDTSSG